MPSRYTAEWVLPIAGRPIRHGWVAIDGDRIEDVGRRPMSGATDLGQVAILPALVNAHTHLELSYLHGRIPPSESLNDWIRTLMGIRRAVPQDDPRIAIAVREAIHQGRAAGTGLFGDVGNSLVTVPLLREAGVAAQVFYELTGFDTPDPEGRVRQAREAVRDAGTDEGGVRVSIAPHAPYSVSPALFKAIRADLDMHPPHVSSVHLGESPDEVELFRHGTGVVRLMLEQLGVWNSEWRVPGVSPVGYLANLGFLDSRVLVVHGVQFDGEDLSRLAALGATLVSCPRSNRYVGVGSPPLEAFFDMGMNVAFGTDSLASVEDLNLFSELAEARRLTPRVSPGRLLESATLTGARALGFERDFGSIEPGKRAALLSVRLPAGSTSDVEEYLLSGIEPDSITWLETMTPNPQDPTTK